MTAVPALKRGCEILKVLNQSQGLGLEQIAVETALPKASLLRLLNTLEEMGMVRKDPVRKHYTALAMLVYHQQDFAQLLQVELQQLAADADACVEWYEAEAGGMRMVQRLSAPEHEVQVSARLGFLRTWQGECDAVAAVARVFCGQSMGCSDTDLTDLWSYDAGGEPKQLTTSQLQKTLAELSAVHFMCDQHYNSNGVKRMAAPIMYHGRCMGIAALAMSFRPQLKNELAAKQECLMQCMRRFKNHLGNLEKT